MMDSLKAYAHQVVSYYPASQRDEMFAEIYDSLCEEFGDLQQSEPDLTETDFLNSAKPHPMKYATEMAADGSAYLVGPQFYFSFLSALKIAAALVVVFHVVIGAVGAIASGRVWPSFWGAMTSMPGTLLWVGAAVLGVFVALEKSGEKASWLERWDAGELKSVNSLQTVSRGEAAFELALSSFLLLWVLDIVQLPVMIRHDGDWIREWTVNLPEGFWLVLGLLLAFDIAFAIYRLTRTLWTSRMRLVTIVTQVVWIGLLGWAANQSGLFSVDHEAAAQFLPVIETATRAGMLVLCAIIAWDTAVHAWRLVKGFRS